MKNKILLLCEYEDLESMFVIKAFSSKKLLNMFLKEHNIIIERDDIGKGFDIQEVELIMSGKIKTK